MRRTLILSALLLASCGGSTPTAPTPQRLIAPPLPEASLVMTDANLTVVGLCTTHSLSCQLTSTGVNQGPGCATAVRGSTELQDVAYTSLISATWALQSSTIIKPGEVFSYFVTYADLGAIQKAKGMYTTFQWANVACP